ncbi:MAG: glycosyltransferase, partial [Thermosphaera sp.]
MFQKVMIIGNQAFSLWNFRGPLIRALVERGHEVWALAPDYNPETWKAIEALGAKPLNYRLSRTGLNPIRDLLDSLWLFLLLRELKPDATLAYAIKPVIYGTLAAWLSRVPRRYAMIEGLGYAFTISGQKEPLKRRFLRLIAKRLYRLALPKATLVF